jgi:hypothetical protein
LNPNATSHRLEVQAFLILERVPGSKEFRVSVLLQADGQFIGKTSLGTAAEGQEILLSLRWDKPKQHFVASSQAAGGVPVQSFIPFASSVAGNALVPSDYSMAKSFVLNAAPNDPAKACESKKRSPFAGTHNPLRFQGRQ